MILIKLDQLHSMSDDAVPTRGWILLIRSVDLDMKFSFDWLIDVVEGCGVIWGLFLVDHLIKQQ